MPERGETFFQHRLPIDPSSLPPLSAKGNIRLPGSGWRGRIGEEGVEWLLTRTIRAGQKSGVIDDDSAKRVAVDTTVMEKNIAYPTDSLYECARDQLVDLAQEAGVELRQSYARLAPWLALQVGRYAHAKQVKRMRKALKKLKGYTGRVMRDLRRHLQDIPEGSLRERIIGKIALVSQLLYQSPKGADKIYALHEPEVDCIRCPADDALHRREGPRARPGCAMNLAARSADRPHWMRASWLACAALRAIPTMCSATNWMRTARQSGW
jgi:IS5 family transposase